jgi:hypothetical protein
VLWAGPAEHKGVEEKCMEIQMENLKRKIIYRRILNK